MPTPLDLTNQRFGRAVAIKHDFKDHHNKWHWLCQCDCGNGFTTTASSLVRGYTKSCGCYQKERASEANLTHGKSHSKGELYQTWAGMKGRCQNPNHQDYPNYGGRGIKVCDRWQDFENFYADMSPKPDDALTLERIVNDGDYSPLNCCWATRTEQQANKRLSSGEKQDFLSGLFD